MKFKIILEREQDCSKLVFFNAEFPVNSQSILDDVQNSMSALDFNKPTKIHITIETDFYKVSTLLEDSPDFLFYIKRWVKDLYEECLDYVSYYYMNNQERVYTRAAIKSKLQFIQDVEFLVSDRSDLNIRKRDYEIILSKLNMEYFKGERLNEQ